MRLFKNKIRKNYGIIFFISIVVILFFIMQYNSNSTQPKNWLQNQELQRYKSAVNEFQSMLSTANEEKQSFKQIIHPRDKLPGKIRTTLSTENIISSQRLLSKTSSASARRLILDRTDNQITTTSAETIASSITPPTPVAKVVTTLVAKNPKMGHVNVHLWYKMCTSTVDSLRLHPLFPLWPSVRGQPEMPNELVSIMTTTWSAQRVMGLLYPPTTGPYRFEIKSLTISEFWLSTNQDPKNAVMLCRNNKNVIFGVSFAKGPLISKSKEVYLKRVEPVYFEIIHSVNDVNGDQVQVQWLAPGEHSYTGIPKTALSTIIGTDSSLDIKTRKLVLQSASLKLEENPIKDIKRYEWKNKNFSKSFLDYPIYTKENLHTANMADHRKILSIFSVCDYAPSYVIKRKYPRYKGVENTHYSDVFPDDTTWNKIWKDCERAHLCQGNKIVEEPVVVDVVDLFMKQLEAKYPG